MNNLSVLMMFLLALGCSLFANSAIAKDFTDVTKEAGVGDSKPAVGVSFNDYDGDGKLDILVTNHNVLLRGQLSVNVLYRNNGDGAFTDVIKEADVGTFGHSMGPIFLDYDNDGDLDLYAANWENDANALYRNNGDGTFTTGLGLMLPI